MAEIYNIPSLPYKQQQFGSLRVETEEDTAMPHSRPFSLTAKQKERSNEPSVQENIYFPPSNQGNVSSDDKDEEIRRNTFIE